MWSVPAVGSFCFMFLFVSRPVDVQQYRISKLIQSDPRSLFEPSL